MSNPLGAAQNTAALVHERAMLQSALMQLPQGSTWATHPRVVAAKQRLAEIDAAIAEQARRQGKLSKKMKRLLPQLIAQVGNANPVVAQQMTALMNGDKSVVPSLLSTVAGAANPQLAALAPVVAAFFNDDNDDDDKG